MVDYPPPSLQFERSFLSSQGAFKVGFTDVVGDLIAAPAGDLIVGRLTRPVSVHRPSEKRHSRRIDCRPALAWTPDSPTPSFRSSVLPVLEFLCRVGNVGRGFSQNFDV